jgi:hypothetical protein
MMRFGAYLIAISTLVSKNRFKSLLTGAIDLRFQALVSSYGFGCTTDHRQAL